MNRRRILGAVAIAGALGAGAVAGLFLGIPGLSGAQSPGPTPSSNSPPLPHKAIRPIGPFGAGSLDVAARALGMTAADLETALGNGQSLAAVAKSKNVDVQKVIDALTQDATSRIDAAVKAGKITQARADTARQNLATRITDFVNRTRVEGRPGVTSTVPPGWGPKLRGGLGVGIRPSLDVAARALGMTAADLKTALGNGQSLAAVAKSKNVDVQKVIAARLTDFVNRTFPAKGRRPGWGPGGGPDGGPGVSRTSFAA